MAPDIRPSSDLRNHYAEISRSCRENRRPTVLTVNGRGDTVIMGLEDFNRMQAELDLLNSLALAEREVDEGKVGLMGDTLARLRSELAGQRDRQSA